MISSNVVATKDYVLDMLEQLSRVAKRDGLDVLAGRIETVVVAEQAAPSDALSTAGMSSSGKAEAVQRRDE